MFGIGTTELVICMVICLILFGNRLPSVMRSMGKGIKEFKEGVTDTSDDLELPADTHAKL
jgi:sec-independent protein translocase protein TatA